MFFVLTCLYSGPSVFFCLSDLLRYSWNNVDFCVFKVGATFTDHPIGVIRPFRIHSLGTVHYFDNVCFWYGASNWGLRLGPKPSLTRSHGSKWPTCTMRKHQLYTGLSSYTLKWHYIHSQFIQNSDRNCNIPHVFWVLWLHPNLPESYLHEIDCRPKLQLFITGQTYQSYQSLR